MGMKPAAERRGPREDLRALYERQDNALAACLALEARAVKLRAALAELDGEQRAALGAFAEITGIDVAASLTGSPVAKVREALGAFRAQDAAAPETTAVVAYSSTAGRSGR